MVLFCDRVPGGADADKVIQKQGPLPPDEVLSILRPLADALDYAHRRGLVHRDVKPGNVIVDPTGQVTLTDFGIVRAARETRLTATGTIVGTPEYMSPEQAQGVTVGARSDLYSLAVVAYEMLSGRVPFEAESALALLHKIVYDPLPSICQVNPDLPVGVEAVMKKALAKDPDDRYEEADAFVKVLERALAGEEVEKKPTLVMEPERPVAVSAPATAPMPEEATVSPSYVQPVSVPAPASTMASAPEPEPDQPQPGRIKVMPPDIQAQFGQQPLGRIAFTIILALPILLDDRLWGQRNDFCSFRVDNGRPQELMGWLADKINT